MALGIIDWGIGGISIYKLLKVGRPDVRVVYFSDTGVTPYGKMSRKELVSRLEKVIDFLISKDATHLAIGCNAASTAIPYLDQTRLPIEGVIDTAVDVAVRSKPTRLGLIGGRRTVVSGVYRAAFAKHGVDVEQRIAQPLSGLIESGDVGSDRLHTEAKRILAPLRNCSHVLLACTHYPAIEDMLRSYVSAETSFIDPASALVTKISKWRIPASEKPDTFFTSGDAGAMKKAARAAFDCRLSNIRTVRHI